MLKILLITLLSLSFSGASTARDVHPIIGKIIRVQGNGTILHAHSYKAEAVKIGDPVSSGASLYCPEKCYITIKLNNELSYIKIGPDTKVLISNTKSTYIVRLFQGFTKVLFKRSGAMKEMIIDMGHAVATITSNKLLAINSTLFDRASIINYKGITKFSPKPSSKNQSEYISQKEYSYFEKGMKNVSKPEYLTLSRYNELLSIFKIKKGQVQ